MAAFYPDTTLPRPLDALRRGIYLIGPPKVIQMIVYVSVFLHVLEASFAFYLAQKVDPSNAYLWFWQSFYMDVFSLNLLLRKGKSKGE